MGPHGIHGSSYDRVCVFPQDGGEYMQFLRQSHQEALKEEERRHRFVAEKHCGLIQSIADIMNKARSLPQIQSVLSVFLDFSFFIESRCQSESVSSPGSLRCPKSDTFALNVLGANAMLVPSLPAS